jgi:hypothetical protein
MSPRYDAVAHIVAQMKTHVRVTAAALILLGLTACTRTTEGSVAMTTEPGPPLTSPSRPTVPSVPEMPGLPDIFPDIEIPGLPNTDLPEVPAPPNATTMACTEFIELDDATKLAVIRAILAAEENPPGPEAEVAALFMADAMCQLLPDSEVNEVLIGIPPP